MAFENSYCERSNKAQNIYEPSLCFVPSTNTESCKVGFPVFREYFVLSKEYTRELPLRPAHYLFTGTTSSLGPNAGVWPEIFYISERIMRKHLHNSLYPVSLLLFKR